MIQDNGYDVLVDGGKIGEIWKCDSVWNMRWIGEGMQGVSTRQSAIEALIETVKKSKLFF